jgi:hypothetical protein
MFFFHKFEIRINLKIKRFKMMKKLLLLLTAVFAFNTAVKSQITVNDTLRYFLYKQRYKLPAASSTVHPFFKSTPAVVSNTTITHMGSIFKNTDTLLKVYGLEARVIVPNTVFSGPQNGGVPFRLYLCNLNAAGLPILPAIDSVYTGLLAPASASVPGGGPLWSTVGQFAGGTFTAGPRTVRGNFAVLARCVSKQDGDSVFIFRTAGHTATSTTAPSAAHKFGEGLGVVRNGGTFFSTRNYNNPRFGVGTDYEFCVAPMVQFTMQVSQIESAIQEGACQWEVFSNTNTSSPELTNRQFNYNEFARQLRPFDAGSAMSTFVSDSVLAWDMGDGQAPFYLPPNRDTIQLLYGSGVFNVFRYGDLRGKYKQSAYNVNPNVQSLMQMITFSASTVWCDDSVGSGVHEMGPLAKAKIYPIPTVDKTIITGLDGGSNSISIYNMLGQLLATEVTRQDTYVVDLLKQPVGNYLLRITNDKNNARLVKIIKE